MRTIEINYKELNNSLNQLKETYPSRLHGNVDLLRANIRDHLFDSLSWDNLCFNVDDWEKKAFIWWKEVIWHVYAIYNHKKNPTSSEKMYEQIIDAEEQAKQLWFYEKVFKESEEQNDKF